MAMPRPRLRRFDRYREDFTYASCSQAYKSGQLAFGTRDAIEKAELERVLSFLRRNTMLWTVFVVLVVLWLLGMVSSYTIGGYIHILLLAALAVMLIRVIQGRQPIS
jgi:hypothetical protein